MRIAIDLTALNDNFTGIERYALNMTLEILRQAPEETFELVFKNEVFSDFLPYQGHEKIHFHVLPGCGKLLFNQWRLPRFLNQLRADRYLFLAFPMPVLLRKKYVLGTIHDMGCWDCPETMKKQMVWYFRLSYFWMAKHAKRIITISEFSRDRIRQILKVPDTKIAVAYCGISPEFQKPYRLTGQQRRHLCRSYHLPEEYILCLSTLEPRKNMRLLLHAYLELYKQGKIKTKLVLAGRTGWKIEALLSEADADESGQVVLTGFIDDVDLPAIYSNAKYFVFPSLYEGFGIPPLEAMAQGVPVIASDASSLPEVLGNVPVYFRSDDFEDLKRALLEMEQISEKDRSRMAAAGLQQSERFRYEREAGKVLKMLVETCR
ncbi:MAG: glycosyltransferase family 4 protein [Lachnospiraceae bacterium]|nr:glycosyltransferase family 4 protein [Lachnospiraceae bacterium]